MTIKFNTSLTFGLNRKRTKFSR